GYAVSEPKIYAKGSLVLWSCKDIDPKEGLKILADPAIRRIAIPNPKNAPYGIQALRALKKAGVYEAVKPKLIFGESVSQTNQYIVSRAADIGITAKSVVRSPKMAGRGRYTDLDPTLYKPIEQGVVLLKYAKEHHPEAARAFYDFLFTPEAKEIFEKYGYTVSKGE
ncbi:MAG: molybdate ABC transporter substrate-binding protein, partial [Campylobacteraceae bacterium 4484_4]